MQPMSQTRYRAARHGESAYVGEMADEAPLADVIADGADRDLGDDSEAGSPGAGGRGATSSKSKPHKHSHVHHMTEAEVRPAAGMLPAPPER